MSNFFNSNINAFKPTNVGKSSLSVFYTNDMHGDIKKIAKLKTAKDTFQKENATNPNLTLSGGDMLLGADKPRNNFIVEFMNKIKLDATTLGNHEFSAKSKGLAETLENAEFKAVSANIEVDEKNELSKHLKNKKLVKSATFMKGGTKFGVIGASPIDSYIGKNEAGENPTKVFDIDKTIKAINDEAKKLEEQGINKIILCSHLGYGEDLDLKVARETEGVDIIIGGHTHTKIDGVNTKNNDGDNKLNLVKSKRNEPVFITQAGGLNEKAGFLNVEFDKNGVLNEKTIVNKLVDVENFEADASVPVMMEKYLGKNETLADVKTPFLPKTSREERLHNNPIHNHYAQALLNRGKESGAEISVFGAPSLRGGMDKQITTYDVKYAMLPFNSDVKVVNLSEKDIVKLLNKNIKTLTEAEKWTPDIYRTGGMSYTISKTPQKDAQGNDIYVKDLVLDNGTTINALNPTDKNIRVAIDDYTFSTTFPEKRNAADIEIIGKEQDIFMDYLKTQKTVDTNLKSRIYSEVQ